MIIKMAGAKLTWKVAKVYYLFLDIFYFIPHKSLDLQINEYFMNASHIAVKSQRVNEMYTSGFNLTH